MNCPYCNAENTEGSLRCAHCSQVMVNPGGTETLAAGALSGGESQPQRRAQQESIGVLTPTPSGSGDQTVSFGNAPSSAPAVVLDPGTNFGPRYQIEGLLGRGGMGVVYKAYDRELDRTVALKLVRPDLTFDPESMRRFKQELLLASRVSHKNILRIHDLGDVDGVKFISMAYVEGKDLHHLLKREGRCTIEQISAIGRQLAAALDAAHNEGVVHRDLKPQNVLIDSHGHAYVMDFGLAKSLEADSSLLTHVGAVLGTPRYMSPEQVEGKPADGRSDIYAMGLILYEMATGEAPFSNDSVTVMMAQRLIQKPKDPKLANPALPRHLANVILRCLETDPAKRYQTAREVEEELGGEQSSKTLHSRAPVQITIAVPESRRSRLVAMAVTLVLLAAIAALIIYERKHPAPIVTEGAGGVPSLAQGKFVAVLPFHIIGNTASLDYLAEGLDEAINAKLFALQGVHVASPGAVQQSLKKGSISAMARELGANLVLQGTLQGDSQKIAVVVSLQDVAGGHLLLAKEFSGVPGDLLTLEDQISGALIGALELHPGGRELAREEQHPTENMAAYSLYLKGQEALRGLPNAEAIQKAMDLYTSALQHDSGFALAYAGLADANLRMYRQTRDRIWVDEATQAATHAQQLNSNLPQVYIALGSVYSATGKNTEAIQVLSRAVALAPNSDDAYRQIGQAYQAGGQESKAIDAFKKAMQIDPYYWVNADELGKAYDAAGNYEKALAQFQQVTRLAPDNAAGYENTGNVYMQKGDFAHAVPVLEKALQLSPSFWQHYSNLGSAYFYVKRFADAAKMLEKAAAINPNQELLVGNLAEAYLFAGQKEKAHATFDKAIALAYGQLQVNPRDADTMGDLAIYYACEGQPEQALQFIRNARSMDSASAQYAYDEAVVQTFAGSPGKAIDALRQAFQKGFPPVQAASDPQLEGLQSRGDFKQLVSEFSKKGR